MTKRRLAGMPDRVVTTPYLAEGVAVAYSAAQTDSIGLFDGPVGTGKTTALEWSLSNLDRPTAFVTMPPKVFPLTALQHITRALTGEKQDGGLRELQDLAIDLLTGWHGLLAVDEVQTIGTAGMAQLQYLHDMSGETFGLLLVGHGTEAAIAPNATLNSRTIERAVFRRLEGDDLLDVLADLDDRLARSSPGVLARVDHKHCAGRLRNWSAVLTMLDRYHPDADRLTGRTADDVLLRLRRPRLADPLDPADPTGDPS